METFQKSAVFNAAKEIDYSKGAIVSKIIIKRDTGNITLFAFDKGQGLSEHSAPFDAVVQVVEGEADVYINKIPHRVKSNESIIMPANIPHALDAVEKFKMILIMIKG